MDKQKISTNSDNRAEEFNIVLVGPWEQFGSFFKIRLESYLWFPLLWCHLQVVRQHREINRRCYIPVKLRICYNSPHSLPKGTIHISYSVDQNKTSQRHSHRDPCQVAAHRDLKQLPF